jgi:hypothetical protein
MSECVTDPGLACNDALTTLSRACNVRIMAAKKSKYTKEQIAAARVEYRAAVKVVRSLREILHPRLRRRRWVDLPKMERRIVRLEERVKRLAARAMLRKVKK